MNDLEKLKHLLDHWLEHNEEHAKTYLEWANKAGASGNQELMEMLNKIAEDTKKIEVLFKKAKALLDNSRN
jgi:hypothetical protein